MVVVNVSGETKNLWQPHLDTSGVITHHTLSADSFSVPPPPNCGKYYCDTLIYLCQMRFLYA